MDCPNEFTLSVFADDESRGREEQQISLHLTRCERCRKLVAELRSERLAFANAFQDVDTLEADLRLEFAGARRIVAELAAFVLGIGLIAEIAWNSVSGLTVPSNLEWMNPFALTGQLNFLLTSLVYLISEGGVMLMSVAQNISVLVAVAFVFG